MSAVGASRPGGRTARTGSAVFEATLAELVERGYDGASVELIAMRAGVHKTTIYRRWQTKGELVAAALEAAAQDRIEIADTGSIDDDLRALAGAIAAALTSTEGLATVRALVSGASRSPGVGPILRRFWAARLAQITPTIDAGIARKELPEGTKAAELMKHLASPLYYQVLLTSDPLTSADADRAAAAALAAARAGVFAS